MKEKKKKVFTKTEFPEALSGGDLFNFQVELGLKDAEMAIAFGVTTPKIVNYLSLGSKLVEDATVCLLYRMYKAKPSLIKKNNINIEQFYRQLKSDLIDEAGSGGKKSAAKDDVLTERNFSLLVGASQTSYVRWFGNPKKGMSRTNDAKTSVKLLLTNALELTKDDKGFNYIKAYHFLKDEVFKVEAMARKFDPLEERNWSFDMRVRYNTANVGAKKEIKKMIEREEAELKKASTD